MFYTNTFYSQEQEALAWGGGYTGLRVCVGCEEMTWLGSWKERGCVWRPAPRAPHISFWEQLKESWRDNAMLPVRLRNSWKSLCPSQLMSSFSVMGSFWFFGKQLVLRSRRAGLSLESSSGYCPFQRPSLGAERGAQAVSRAVGELLFFYVLPARNQGRVKPM